MALVTSLNVNRIEKFDGILALYGNVTAIEENCLVARNVIMLIGRKISCEIRNRGTKISSPTHKLLGKTIQFLFRFINSFQPVNSSLLENSMLLLITLNLMIQLQLTQVT